MKTLYSTHKFNYNFPDGLEELLKSNSIIAINAYDWDFKTVIDLDNIENNKKAITSNIYVEGKSFKSNLNFEGKDDKLLLLNHADFTMICDKNNGDYEKYGWKHIIAIPIDSTRSKEIKIWRNITETSSIMIFQLNHSAIKLENNELINIEKIPTHNKG